VTASRVEPVTGRPPNHASLTRRSSADTDGDVGRILGKLERGGFDYTVVRILANSAPVFRPFVLFSDALNHRSVVAAAVREAVVLAAAARTGSRYEWVEHVPLARRAGLDEAQIAAAGSASLPEGVLDAEQALAVAVTHAVLDGAGVPPSLWGRAVDTWGTAGVLELLAMVGWWGAFLPAVLGALGLEAPDAPAADEGGA